jgi:tRNA A37 threonylcarbamoyladenosine biosynthesis protein TsaE
MLMRRTWHVRNQEFNIEKVWTFGARENISAFGRNITCLQAEVGMGKTVFLKGIEPGTHC